ncbi:exopolysaccharide biosynthesis protein [Paracoccus actinidiae]|uniref:exopolysaccharide biosynthesis protein n=1 Tax=Paracoccus actinidiae TaxID=3064531 RepID=UPI0027D31DF7|nr:exopolysaccharide biosynthesis protein [Paracoccus sp. M09]
MSDGSQPALSPASEEDAGDEDRSRQPLSRLIDRLAARRASDRLTLTLLVAWFQDRATLALLMIFGILNMLPNPPGSSMILGMPMLYLSLAMLLDRRPWFPRVIMERGISSAMVATIAARASPVLRRCERLMRPRLHALSEGWAYRVSGLLCLILSIILILPVPLGNIPPAACMTALALALAMRDGLGVLLVWALSLTCLVLMSGIIVATVLLVARVATGFLS